MPQRFDHCETISGKIDDCLRIEREISRLAAERRFAEDDVARIRLAVHEAVANAVVHGHRRNPDLPVTIAFTIREEEVRVRVSDQGSGFDPARVPNPTAPERLTEPGGRGLLLIRRLMSGVLYNTEGNQVEFWKTRETLRSEA